MRNLTGWLKKEQKKDKITVENGLHDIYFVQKYMNNTKQDEQRLNSH